VLLAFWSPTDEESIEAVASLEKNVAESGDKVKLVKVDMSRKKRIAQRFNVTEIGMGPLCGVGPCVYTSSVPGDNKG